MISPDLAAKRLEILKETLPRAERIGVLGCASGEPVGKAQWLAVQSVADRMEVRLVPMWIQRIEELPGALENAIRKGIEAVLVFDCRVLSPPASVTSPLNKARLPAVYHAPRYVHADGLMSYGANSELLYRRSAVFVDKILKGAKPADSRSSSRKGSSS